MEASLSLTETGRRRATQAFDAGFMLGLIPIVVAFLAMGLLVAREDVYHSDDAYILYSYAVNFAESGVISYYPGGPPTEGATDFLFMVVLAALAWMGAPMEIASVAVSSVAAAISFAAVRLIAAEAMPAPERRDRLILGICISTLLLGTNHLLAAAMGFGVYVFLAALSLMVLFFLRGNNAGLYPAALATCLARPDGFVFAAPLSLVALWRERRATRNWLLFAGTLLVPGLAYFAWRLSYFEMLLPLPFYVKTSATPSLFGLFYPESLEQNLRGLIEVPLLVLATALLFVSARQLLSFARAHAVLAVTAVIGFAFYAAIAQHANAGYRYQAPLYLLALVMLLRLPSEHAVRLRLAIVAALAALAMAVSVFSTSVASSRYDNVIGLAKALRSLPGGTMLVTEAGRFPYESRWTAIDSWGLNTPEFARRVITPQHVRELAPDLIVIHSRDDVRRIALRAFREGTEKEWDTQARNILLGAGFDYDLYYVPFSFASTQPDQPRQRYDLFLVRRTSELAPELRSLILRFGGVDTEDLLRRLRISVG